MTITVWGVMTDAIEDQMAMLYQLLHAIVYW